MTQRACSSDVRRIDFGYFVRPASESPSGAPQVEPVYGYVVRHPEVTIFFDSGIGLVDDETELHYRPQRRPLELALRDENVAVDDITVLVNSHLHFDHCGGNSRFGDRPILVQSEELQLAQEPNYTVAELVDFPGARYESLDGETEIADGVVVLPTPGHSQGHQSLLVRAHDGTVFVAGQAMDFSFSGFSVAMSGGASAFASVALARRVSLERGVKLPRWPAWFDRVLQFDPARVVFAHDGAIFTP